jgi:zinc/manganese transport system substrate-binding protein
LAPTVQTMKTCFLLFLSGLALSVGAQTAAPVSIVAAENFSGDVARQVAGPSVQVISILSNPNQDPHEFQTDAKTAKAVADADIVIYSGIGYDDWMGKLLGAQGKPNRVVINVARLIGAKDGENPHIWYDPKTMPALAAKLGEILQAPTAAANFTASMTPELNKIAELEAKCSGLKVTATEPVFGYMAAALGFDMLNNQFQVAVMNDTEPSFQQTADYEKSLTSHAVKVLFYNSQVTDPVTQRMQMLAKDNHIPVVGVTETQPLEAKSYQDWMLRELASVEAALKQTPTP